MLEILKRIEDLREELHDAMDKGNGDDILHKSSVLDKEILKLINSSVSMKNIPEVYRPKYGGSL